ncbi:hypothetical protein J7M22_10755 [Candidatus Poribacteria bacterium]|nr:hypothetical protein [Candidatus Poribacteria bacterium]
MLDECAKAGLPEPEFEDAQGAFWLTFRKDILTEEYLRSLGLNDRQIKAVLYVKQKGRITNREYQQLNQVSKATATRDLTDLVARELLRAEGVGKRGIHYVLIEPKMSQK